MSTTELRRGSIAGRRARAALWMLAGALLSTSAWSQTSEALCGSLAVSYGPFDYRADHYLPPPGDNTPHADRLRVVESVHFTPSVEQLIRGNTGRSPLGDIEYTLKVFPNHHRALVTMIRLWEKTKVDTPDGLSRPIECYFERAIRFRPDDNIARMLYATFLLKGKRKQEAVVQLDFAKRAAGENAFTHFNIGQIYMDAEMYDQALEQAHVALRLGLPRRELAQRLAAVGRWVEPKPEQPSASSAQGLDGKRD